MRPRAERRLLVEVHGLLTTPAKINGGEHDLLATYGGDPEHGRATTRLALEVTPANDETDSATRISLPAKLTGDDGGRQLG